MKGTATAATRHHRASNRKLKYPLLTPHVAMSLFMVAVAAVALVMALSMGYRARLFPIVILIPMLTLGIVQLFLDVKAARNVSTRPPIPTTTPLEGEAEEAPEESVPLELQRKRSLGIQAWLWGLLGGVGLIGFLPATMLFVFSYLLVEARSGLLKSILFASSMGGFLYFFVVQLFRIALPAGVISYLW